MLLSQLLHQGRHCCQGITTWEASLRPRLSGRNALTEAHFAGRNALTATPSRVQNGFRL
jgi:hypothetical protein